MSRNDLPSRLRSFSLRCFKLAEALPNTAGGRYMQNQLIRSSMSANANYRAALLGQSTAAFIAKLSIALEETDECNNWIDMIIATGLMSPEKAGSLLKESKELSNILASARKTARKNNR
jgi:four helix bundle protein